MSANTRGDSTARVTRHVLYFAIIKSFLGGRLTGKAASLVSGVKLESSVLRQIFFGRNMTASFIYLLIFEDVG